MSEMIELLYQTKYTESELTYTALTVPYIIWCEVMWKHTKPIKIQFICYIIQKSDKEIDLCLLTVWNCEITNNKIKW